MRIIKSLRGISQITNKNYLYLCGTSDDTQSSVNSYLLKYDIYSLKTSPSFLISSIYGHYNPSLIFWKNEFLFVIGGKSQIKCEYFNTIFLKWKEINELPEERYKCSLLSSESNNCIFLFGGISEKSNQNSNTILKLTIENYKFWETITITENETFLARNSSIAFQFERSNIIYICGGVDDNGNNTEYIAEYHTLKKKVRKYEYSLKKLSAFNLIGCVNLNKKHFAFIDNDYYIQTVSRENFKMKMFEFNDLLYNVAIKRIKY